MWISFAEETVTERSGVTQCIKTNILDADREPATWPEQSLLQGTGSVGRALVESFCLSGYRVFQYNTNRTAAEELANAHGGTALSLDFSKTTSLDVEATDILINNAAVNISRVNTIDVTLEDWEKNILINLTWPFVLIKNSSHT